MAYWLDDAFDTWPETIRAGSAAAGLYVRCGAWISRSIAAGLIADAVIPAEVATMYGTPEWVRKLLDVGLWEVEGTGFRDVRFFVAPNGNKLNPTAERVAQKRESNRRRQSKHAAKKRVQRTAPNATANALGNALLTVAPSPPLRGDGARGARGPTKRHPFAENEPGSGWCTCGLPRQNQIHPAA